MPLILRHKREIAVATHAWDSLGVGQSNWLRRRNLDDFKRDSCFEWNDFALGQ